MLDGRPLCRKNESDIKLWDIQGEYFSGKYDLAGSEFKIWPKL